MDKVRFVFSEAVKVLVLTILSLLAAKAVESLKAAAPGESSVKWAVLRGVLYAATLALALLGARGLGNEVSAGIHAWAAENQLAHFELDKAYANALRAVELRPGALLYWQLLATTKLAEGQFASALKDEEVFKALSKGSLDAPDKMRFALCHYFLGEYSEAIAITQQMIRHNPFYPAPYVLQGMAYTAQKKYPQAEQTFLNVLQKFPSQASAVEGLAHVYFLAGNRARAQQVLDSTAKFSFSPQARQRFEILKAFYAR